MKKLLIALVVLILLAVGGVTFGGGSALRAGAEAGAKHALQVDTQVGGGALNVFTGSAGLSGLVVGNPPGFATDRAIAADSIDVKVSLGSLMSDPIVIERIDVRSPEITLEANLSGTNLGKILDNARRLTKGSKDPAPKEGEKAQRRLKVGEMRITGARVRVAQSALVKTEATIQIPELVLRDFGTGKDGSSGETTLPALLERTIAEILRAIGAAGGDLPDQVLKSVRGEATRVLEDLGDPVKGVGDEVKKTAEDALKGVGDIFK